MAQYKTFIEGTTRTYTDGSVTFRNHVRSGVYHIDQTLTATGFSGSEDTDWESLHSLTAPTGLAIFRHGVRSGGFVIDQTLTGTGFSGSENTDWEQIAKLNT